MRTISGGFYIIKSVEVLLACLDSRWGFPVQIVIDHLVCASKNSEGNGLFDIREPLVFAILLAR